MTIQKKSLISTLNTTKKAIVASTPGTGVSTSEVRTNMSRTNQSRTNQSRTNQSRTNQSPDEPEPDKPKPDESEPHEHAQEVTLGGLISSSGSQPRLNRGNKLRAEEAAAGGPQPFRFFTTASGRRNRLQLGTRNRRHSVGGHRLGRCPPCPASICRFRFSKKDQWRRKSASAYP